MTPSTMKTLCVTGINPLALTGIFQTLQQAGLAPARASGRDAAMTLEVWHDQARHLMDIEPGERISVSTGRFLEHVADDIFAANLTQSLWGWNDTRSVWLLDFWLAFDPRIQFLLVMTRPEQMLAQTLLTDAQTLSAPQVLEQWRITHQHLLRFHLRHPQRSLLVLDEDGLAHPDALLERCASQWVIEAGELGPVDRQGLPSHPVALHLAREYCNTQPDIQALYQELTASVLPLVENLPAVTASAQFTLDSFQAFWWQSLNKTDALDSQSRLSVELQARLDELSGENAKLTQARDEQAKLATERQAQITQLTQARDEQAKLATDRQTQIGQLTQARDEQAKLATERQGQIDTLTHKSREGEQENELLLLQLHQVQEELEQYFLKHQEAQQQLQTAQQLATERQGQIGQITQARDEQAKLATERQTQIGQLTQARDEQAKLAAERQTQIGQLTQARDEQAKLATERQAQITQLTQARDEQAKLAAERQGQIGQLTQARDEQAKLATDRQTQIDTLTHKSREGEQENELLLLQLHQVQEELEHYFLKHQDAQQQVQRLQSIEGRFERMRQQVADYCGYGGIELDRPKDTSTDTTRLNWRLLELDIRGRYFPKLVFDTCIEFGVAGLILPRQSDDTDVLVRWPTLVQEDNSLLVIPVCSQSNAARRMEILADLSTSDWQFIKLLSRHLHFIQRLPHTQDTLAELVPESQVQAFQKLVDILHQYQPIFRYDQVSAGEATESPAAEVASLALCLEKPSFGPVQWPLFTLRLDWEPDDPDLHLVLTIPATDAKPVLSHWFDTHTDTECLTIGLAAEVRSAVWSSLSEQEHQFVTSLIKRLPAILRVLGMRGVSVVSPRLDWIERAEAARDSITRTQPAADSTTAAPVQATRGGRTDPRRSPHSGSRR